MLLLRFVGVLLLRLAARQFCGLLFQLPPRSTRFAPSIRQLTFSLQFAKVFVYQRIERKR